MSRDYDKGPTITCSCGASIQIRATLLVTQAEQQQRFLDAHAVCLEKLTAEVDDQLRQQRFQIAEYEGRLRYAEEALREVTRLSGADLSDGFPTWPPLHQFAVEEVKRLREDYDAALNEIPLTPASERTDRPQEGS